MRQPLNEPPTTIEDLHTAHLSAIKALRYLSEMTASNNNGWRKWYVRLADALEQGSLKIIKGEPT
jgi:hypothetical protein